MKWISDVPFWEMDLPCLDPRSGGEGGDWDFVQKQAISGACTSRSHPRNLRNGLQVSEIAPLRNNVYVIWATELPLLPRMVVQPAVHCKRPERSLWIVTTGMGYA